MKNTSPIFIIGTERSGSNLLRLILNAHPNISIPHPPHILKEMAPLARFYGELEVDSNFRRLVRDTVRLVELHFFPWEIKIDPDRVYSEAIGRNLYCVKAAIYEQYMRSSGRRRWGCKSTFVIHQVDLVRKYHPDAKFIHLVRDGRDVAVSSKKSVFNHFHPYYVGKLWSLQQKIAAELGGRLRDSEFATVRYEDLLEEPEGTVRKICRFIEEDYTAGMLNFFMGEEALKLSGMSRSWDKCSSPVIRNNRVKYTAELSGKEIEIFETTAFEELRRFGYRIENDYERLKALSAAGAGPGLKFKYWLSEKTIMLYVELKSFFSDKNAILRLRKRLFVLIRKLQLTATFALRLKFRASMEI